eukprot:TRINITY_DN10923_c0_g1_i1.p1 TRINITY_DN10923_c0_g1~~TRINITY_DN10923_c0_g1_i1.p1  ORF type:complete len:510 (+),score=128.48 TRINITY_DN10923_c0_g1_i1:3-1532(+)
MAMPYRDVKRKRGVYYRCSCNTVASLSYLYWSRHCLALRCGRCTQQEIDGYYSADLLREFMPSSENKSNRNRDMQSLSCPLCETTCSLVPLPDQPPQEDTSKLKCYLLCPHCQWNSKTLGITGTQEEIGKGVDALEDTPAAKQMAKVCEYYQGVASEQARFVERLRQQEIQKAYRKSRTYSRYTYSRNQSMLKPAQAKLKVRERLNKRFDVSRNEWVEKETVDKLEGIRSVATADWGLPSMEEYQQTDLSLLSTPRQLLNCPDTQPSQASALPPFRKSLLAKRSKRDKESQHNLVKPELNPSSCKFKLHHFAISNVPSVTIESAEGLAPGQTSTVVLRVSNPLDSELAVTFNPPLPDAPVTEEPSADAKAAGTDANAPGLRSANTGRDMKSKVPKPFHGNSIASFPKDPVKLLAHDAMRELGPEEATSPTETDPSEVVDRRGSTVRLKVTVVVDENAELSAQLPLIVAFESQAAGAKADDETVYLALMLNLGELPSAAAEVSGQEASTA